MHFSTAEEYYKPPRYQPACVVKQKSYLLGVRNSLLPSIRLSTGTSFANIAMTTISITTCILSTNLSHMSINITSSRAALFGAILQRTVRPVAMSRGRAGEGLFKHSMSEELVMAMARLQAFGNAAVVVEVVVDVEVAALEDCHLM
jgi:hypothetical protein